MKAEFQTLYTEAGERLRNDPSAVPWNAYPRPHLRRKEWLNLNGFWEIETESGFKGTVRVPFPLESPLSGFEGQLRYGEKLVYRRRFTLPESWKGRRILLHVGAVSRESLVRVNGIKCGRSDFAYFEICEDITKAVCNGENSIEIECVNDLDPAYPYGKQKLDRGGMWYTPCSGVWQTVWLEPVPEQYVKRIECRIDGNTVRIEAKGVSSGEVICRGRRAELAGGSCRLEFETPEYWSPEEPNLYEFTVKSGEDEVESYFAFRTVGTAEVNGKPRLLLNGKPYFFNGLLDQGYYSDGLWTPAEPEEYERDIMKMKSLGFNTLRKHIKVEPELFYYYCDKLGMAVFQDMVNNGKYGFFRDTLLPTLGLIRLGDRRVGPRCGGTLGAFKFNASMKSAVFELKKHPSVVYWTIFNEGWGQFEADAYYDALRQLDDTRMIDSTSGWFHQKKTDVMSLHIYFKKLRLGKRRELPQVVSEFGGYVLKLPEHSFNLSKTYGYRLFSSRDAFVSALRKLYLEEVVPLAENGLSAAVYTQVSDVEDETNGILTYDRRVMKLAPEDMAGIAEALQEAVKK